MTPSTEWKLRSVTVNPRGEAPGDNAERYLIKFKAGSTPFVLLTSDGLPVSINSEIDYQPAPVPNPVPVNVKPEISVLKRPEARQAMTEDMLQAQSTAKRAELAAARIFELRQSRSDIISGQADNMPSGWCSDAALCSTISPSGGRSHRNVYRHRDPLNRSPHCAFPSRW